MNDATTDGIDKQADPETTKQDRRRSKQAERDAGPALVEVRKGDETLLVHPATVAAHVAVGWTIAEAAKGV